MRMKSEREAVVEYGMKLVPAGLTTGTGGNISVLDRASGVVAISPSAMDYARIGAEDVVLVDLDGKVVEGSRKPSTETPLHLAVYRVKPEIGAVVHTHPAYSTTVACLGWEIPAMHYLVGFSGHKVPLAPYATYGSDDLARLTAAAIGPHNAVLMANHGLLTVGKDVASAFTVSEIVELMARVYLQAKAVGEPRLLSPTQMDDVLLHFGSYGQAR